MSRQLKKSLKPTYANQSTKKSYKENNSRHNIKTIQIFMKDIDQQIQKSYIKLRQQKQKQSHVKKISILQNETLPHEEFSLEEKSIKYHENITDLSEREDQNITLINNKDVLDYINLVYELYSIKDPMKQSKASHSEIVEEKSRTNNQKHYSTNKKIKVFKENFQKTLGSASTMKNSFNFHQIQLNPFKTVADKPSKNNSRNNSSFGTKIQVITLHAKNKSAINDPSNFKTQKPKSSNLKNRDQIPIKKKFIIEDQSQKKQISFSPIETRHTPQLFRYCFMCEQPILQSNLCNHELQCYPLKCALNKQFSEIIILLDQKINRLIREINNQLIQKEEVEITKDFFDIKSHVKSWINKLPNDYQSKHSEQDWRNQFNKISQKINNSVCKSFESINKLQWFSRLKENIANKYLQRC